MHQDNNVGRYRTDAPTGFVVHQCSISVPKSLYQHAFVESKVALITGIVASHVAAWARSPSGPWPTCHGQTCLHDQTLPEQRWGYKPTPYTCMSQRLSLPSETLWPLLRMPRHSPAPVPACHAMPRHAILLHGQPGRVRAHREWGLARHHAVRLAAGPREGACTYHAASAAAALACIAVPTGLGRCSPARCMRP
jgi:hypothetical protein